MGKVPGLPALRAPVAAPPSRARRGEVLTPKKRRTLYTVAGRYWRPGPRMEGIRWNSFAGRWSRWFIVRSGLTLLEAERLAAAVQYHETAVWPGGGGGG